MSKTIERDGRAIAYRVVGEGSLTVVMVHGWMTDGRVWDGFVGAFPQGVARFVIVDRAGVGGSSKAAPGSIESDAEDVLAVARREAPGAFVLAGHSSGGQVACVAASKAGQALRGLVLINPVPVGGLPLPPDALALFRTSGGDAGKQGTILDIACKKLSPELRASLVAIAGTISPDTIVRALDVWTRGLDAHDAGAVEAPVLVVASDDPFLPADFLRERVANAYARGSLVKVPGGGHYVQAELPEETVAVVRPFLASLAT